MTLRRREAIMPPAPKISRRPRLTVVEASGTAAGAVMSKNPAVIMRVEFEPPVYSKLLTNPTGASAKGTSLGLEASAVVASPKVRDALK